MANDAKKPNIRLMLVLVVTALVSVAMIGAVSFAVYTNSRNAQRTVASYGTGGAKFSSNYLKNSEMRNSVHTLSVAEASTIPSTTVTVSNYVQGKQTLPLEHDVTYTLTAKYVYYDASEESEYADATAAYITANNYTGYTTTISATIAGTPKTVTLAGGGTLSDDTTFAGVTLTGGTASTTSYVLEFDTHFVENTGLLTDLTSDRSAALTSSDDYVVSDGSKYYRYATSDEKTAYGNSASPNYIAPDNRFSVVHDSASTLLTDRNEDRSAALTSSDSYLVTDGTKYYRAMTSAEIEALGSSGNEYYIAPAYRYGIGQRTANLYVAIVAAPTNPTSLPTIVGVFKPELRSAGVSNSWEGRFSDSHSVDPEHFDGFNYLIEGTGTKNITLQWGSEVEISEVSLAEMAALGANVSTPGTITFTANSDVKSRYELQFYKSSTFLVSGATIEAKWAAMDAIVTCTVT